MIHIIEGTDATGKSTYSKVLAHQLDGHYLHASAPTQATWGAEYVDPLVQLLQAQPGKDIVCDRWHIGEIVWPQIFGRPSLFKDMKSFSHCCRALALLDVQTTVVLRDEASIIQTLEKRGEEDQIELVLEGQRLYSLIADAIPHLPVRVVHSDVLWAARSKGALVPCMSMS